MSVDKLRQEQMEYTLRIEEVLSGMDRVLIDFANRVTALEKKIAAAPAVSVADRALLDRVGSLEEQVSTIGLAIRELLAERK